MISAAQTASQLLAGFDDLPDDAQVDVKVLAALRSAGISTVWLHVRKGLLPQPRRFGGSTRWRVGDIRAALAGDGVAA